MSLADKLITGNPNSLNGNLRGMTLLEHYAGLAMQGLCSVRMQSGYSESTLRYNAEFSVAQAKALIAELEKVQP